MWTRNVRKFIKPSKDSYCSLESKKTLNHKIGWIVGLPGDDVINANKYAQTSFHYVNINEKPEISNQTFFCSLSYKSWRVFRGLEQLSSLFWRRVMVIFQLGLFQPKFPFVGVEILTTFWLLWHNFASRYAGKPIKGPKDSDDSLVSTNNLRQIIGPLDWRPGPGKGQKHPYLWRPPREPQT